MPGSEPVRHHLASRGLQNNFANDEKMLTILDAANAAVVEARQSATSDFAEDHFNSVMTPASLLDEELVYPWVAIESSVLELAQAVSPANAHEDDTRAAVGKVFAAAIVRSYAYLEAHAASDAAEHEGDNSWFVDSISGVYDELAIRFAARHVQVISTPPELPGFILSDVPIIHVDSQTRRYGFRDELDIDDADLIVGPLTRRTAVCLTAEPMEHFAVATKKATQLINAAFWRSAREVIACHPDDAREARRVFSHLGDLPVAKLIA